MEDLGEEIPITIECVALFIEECITFVLSWHNLSWFPPVSIESLRKYSRFDLYSVEIGKALAEDCMEHYCISVADLVDFNVEAWLQMPIDEAREYVKQHFLEYTFALPVNNQFQQLFLWAFACYLCRRAVMHNRRIFISHVFSQLLNLMYSTNKYLSYYEYLDGQATLYNFIHFQFHNRHPDVGYFTESDEDNSEDF